MLGRNDEALARLREGRPPLDHPAQRREGAEPVADIARSRRARARPTAAWPRPITGWVGTTRRSRNTAGRSRSIRATPTPTSAAAMPAPRSASNESALADYNEAVRLGPGFSRAYSSRGKLLAAMGQDEAALADLRPCRPARSRLRPRLSPPRRPALAAGPERPGPGGFRRGDPPQSRRPRRIQGPGRGPGSAGPVPAGDRRPEQGHRARPEPGHRLPQPRGGVQQPGPVRAGDRRPGQGDHARPEERGGPHEHRAGLLHDRPVRPVDREPERGGAAGSRNAIVHLNRGNVYARLGFKEQAVQRLRDGGPARLPA